MVIRDDVISEIIRLMLKASNEHGGITESLAVEIENQVRADWGGEQCYIARNHDERIAARNEKIYEAYWEKGHRNVKALAQRYGLSERQVRRIVNG